MLQAAFWHWLPCGQSAAARQATQLPLPSQNVALVQGEWAGRSMNVALPPLHTGSVHSLPSSGGVSVSSTMDCVAPAPSQTTVWQSPEVWLWIGTPFVTELVPHWPATHVATMHSFPVLGQSEAPWHWVGQQSRGHVAHDSRLSQMPFPQKSVLQRPQSFAQLAQFSPTSQTPLPQPEHTPQSRSHVTQLSFFPQTPLPQ
jgi:hypothetical protein